MEKPKINHGYQSAVLQVEEINTLLQEIIYSNKASNRQVDGMNKISQLKANHNSLECEIYSKYDIDFTREDSLAELLGYGKSHLEKEKMHESTLSVNIDN
ncbi:hypothetical protein JTB14_011260 [Gonioctena quinquepunctata]|nr:hypothetical protein JTB14_011260 [Gonioctena quinquepunctata]